MEVVHALRGVCGNAGEVQRKQHVAHLEAWLAGTANRMECVQLLLQVVEGVSTEDTQSQQDATSAVLFLKNQYTQYFVAPHAASREIQELIVSRIASVLLQVTRKFGSDPRGLVILRVLGNLLFVLCKELDKTGNGITADVLGCFREVLLLRRAQPGMAIWALLAAFEDLGGSVLIGMTDALDELLVAIITDVTKAAGEQTPPQREVRDSAELVLTFGVESPPSSAIYKRSGELLMALSASRCEANYHIVAAGMALLDPRLENAPITHVVQAALSHYRTHREQVGGDAQSLELEGLTSAVAAVCKGYCECLVHHEVPETLEANPLLQEVLAFCTTTTHDPVSLSGVQAACRYCERAGDTAGTARIVSVAVSGTTEGPSALVPTRHDFVQEQEKACTLNLLAAVCDGSSGEAVGVCLRQHHRDVLNVLAGAVRVFAERASSPDQVHTFSDFLEALFDAITMVSQRLAHGLDESDEFAEQLMICLNIMADTMVRLGTTFISTAERQRPPSVTRGASLVAQLATHHIQTLCSELSTEEVFKAVGSDLSVLCNGVAAMIGPEGASVQERLTLVARQDQVLGASFITTCSTLGFFARAFSNASAVLQSSAHAVNSIAQLYDADLSPDLTPFRSVIKPDILGALLELLGSSAVVVLEEGGDGGSVLQGVMTCCGNCLHSEVECLQRSAFTFMSRVVIVYGDACAGVIGDVLLAAQKSIGASEKSASNSEARPVEVAALQVVGDASAGIEAFGGFMDVACSVLTEAVRHPHPRLQVAACFALERLTLSHISTPTSPHLPRVASAALHAARTYAPGPPHNAAAALASILCPLLPQTYEGLPELTQCAESL